MIWNSFLQRRYSSLLFLVEIAKVHCFSTITCQKAFSFQNCIKTKFCNRLKIQRLENVLHVALEGLEEGSELILFEAIAL